MARPHFLSTLFALTACASTSAPLLRPRTEASVPLPAGDRRRSLAGLWNVNFAIDSVQAPLAGSRAVMQAGSGTWVTGTLQLTDTLVVIRGLPLAGLRATVEVDFTSSLGRQVSCFTPGEGLVEVQLHPSRLQLLFTPGAADCGFAAEGSVRGDSVVGAWNEASYVGHRTAGRFFMVRSP